MIIDEVCKEILEYAPKVLKLVDYGVGIKYTYAVVSDGIQKSIGVAYTPLEDVTHAEEPLYEITLKDTCSLISSVKPLHKSLGISIINSISQLILKDDEVEIKGDIIKYLKINPNDAVLIIGYMEPLVKAVKSITNNVFVIERNPAIRRDGLPDVAIWRVAPKVNKVIITGATLVNDTLDLILKLCENAEVKAIVGPTAQLHPKFFFSIGINVVGSVKITDVDKAVSCIKLGCGAKSLYKLGFKYVSANV